MQKEKKKRKEEKRKEKKRRKRLVRQNELKWYMNYKVTNKNILMCYIIIVNLYIKKVKNMNVRVITHTCF